MLCSTAERHCSASSHPAPLQCGNLSGPHCSVSLQERCRIPLQKCSLNSTTPQLDDLAMTIMIELLGDAWISRISMNIQIWAQWQCSMGIRPKHAEHNEKKDCKQHHILFASKGFSFKLSVSTRSKCPETSHCSFSSQSVCFIWVGSNKKLLEARSLACFHMFSPVGVSKECFDVRPVFQAPLGPEATG